jgi:hypothetical protein
MRREKNGMYGKRHTEEAKRKMNEAAKRRRKAGRPGGYNLLIVAIVKQAVKDKAAWFFETETGRNYCAAAGFAPDALLEKLSCT